LFYDRLNDLCSRAGTTITAFAADYLHVSNATPTSWKKGSSPKLSMVAVAAKYFNVSADYLLGITDDPRPISAVTKCTMSEQDTRLFQALQAAPEATRNLVYKMAFSALSMGECGPQPAFISSLGQVLAHSSPATRPYPKQVQAASKRTGARVWKGVEGKTAAGPPITTVPADDQRVMVPVKYTGEQYFLVQAEGDSMLGIVNDGDFCVINKRGHYDDGRIVLVQVDGPTDQPDTTLKRIYRRPGDRVELRSENRKYPPMFFPAKEVLVMGELVAVLRPDCQHVPAE